MEDPKEIERQLKKLDDWDKWSQSIDSEAIVKKRLEDFLKSNPLTQEISDYCLKQVKEEAGDERQNMWKTKD